MDTVIPYTLFVLNFSLSEIGGEGYTGRPITKQPTLESCHFFVIHSFSKRFSGEERLSLYVSMRLNDLLRNGQ